ncbi:bifunctional 2-polyprenyl-6-hydroxyphenol methylase/3-demethylubiquinol 3-O-methyltransferase UbiG, partial [Pelagibacteraceae bacterium]|nr:bifunctional 2-polyprenyl-6-hydroxyphenol methylase/3-demethylubiquinol 3-O-methyltransferase UbiG [Pelagibacteraceae bacterium]
MNKKTANEQEVKKFSDMASEWWDPNGKFSPLHKFNPVRQEYLINRISSHFSLSLDKNFSFSNLTLLDIGCGGGLLCEPFARLGAQVTGIDASKNNIEVAKVHAQKTNLQIQYLNKLPEEIKNKKFDVILCMEVIEHVDNVNFFIESCSRLLNKNGIIFFATINRNPKSYLFAIMGAEYILRWLPIGTHDWKKFIKPQEMINYVSTQQLIHQETKGVTFNP